MLNTKFRLPEYIYTAAELLLNNGYEANLVGGSLRDNLLGKAPKDYDIATNAYPEDIERLFTKSIPTGAKFGTMLVIIPDENNENQELEITTYRSEADYYGGRWPAKVEFTKTIAEDLSRRDFTINAMALNLAKRNFELADIKDPFNGLLDLENKIIRAVGNPLTRFSEDGLRSIRACRLAANLEFSIAEDTFEAISKTLHVTALVSKERVRDELMKLLLNSPKPSVGIILLKDSGLLKLIIPELLEEVDVVQPLFHTDDVFTHSLKSLDIAEDRVKLAALLHDIGKPRTMTKDDKGIHFYGHDLKGAEMVREIMTRLKFPSTDIKQVETLVRWHMFYYPTGDWRKQNDPAANLNELTAEQLIKVREEHQESSFAGGWSDAAIRRFIHNVGGEEMIDDLMRLRIADATSNTKSVYNPEELRVLSERISNVRLKDMALKITDLEITGRDLIVEFNLKPSKSLGNILNYLLDKVIDDPNLNEKERLLALSKDYLARLN